jgi:hypothetical protein
MADLIVLIEFAAIFGVVIWFGLSQSRRMRRLREAEARDRDGSDAPQP